MAGRLKALLGVWIGQTSRVDNEGRLAEFEVGSTAEGRSRAQIVLLASLLAARLAQVRTQAPACRSRPMLRSRRRFRAAVRVWSQALFFAVPR